MILAVDIGNTNVTLGLVQGEAVISSRRAATPASITADEMEVLVDGLLRLDGAGFAEVTGIALASVVPDLSAIVSQVAERHGLPLLAASVGNVPMTVRMQRPSEVGPDRLVNGLAVGRLYGTPAIVIDFGTATTFDCISSDGAYVGGAIAPGPTLVLEALVSRTARLPRIEPREPATAIGTDTVSAMQSGVVLGYRALTAGLLERLRLELARDEKVEPGQVQVVLTGGLSGGPWAAELPGVDAVDPDLTLKGLGILWTLASGEPEGPASDGGSRTVSAAGSVHVIPERER